MPIFWSRIFCSSSGSETVLHRHRLELQAEFLEVGRSRALDRLGELDLVGGQIEEGDAALRHAVGDVLQHHAAQLALQVGHRVGLAGARDLGVEGLRIADAEGVVAEGAQAHRAEVLVADRDRLRGAPALVDLLARAEEVDVALERALEQLVPVLQVGQHRQGLRRQLVRAGAEHVGHLALVDEDGHLRFAHHELAAVLDFHVLPWGSATRARRRPPRSTAGCR
jgi:hypothetical protein